MNQTKIFEGNGNNEEDVNIWLRKNPNAKVTNTNMVPMHDLNANTGEICNQWIATIITYEI